MWYNNARYVVEPVDVLRCSPKSKATIPRGAKMSSYQYYTIPVQCWQVEDDNLLVRVAVSQWNTQHLKVG